MNAPSVHSAAPVSGSACRAAAHLGRTVERALTDADISPAGYRVLSWLAMGDAAAAVLADKLAVSRPTVTLVVDGLQARGLVSRTADERDRRRVTISMTAAGQAALADADGVVRATVVRLPDGTGYVTNKGLEELPSGRTYQMWALIDDKTGPAFVSAGVLGRDLDVAVFRFNGRVRGFGISTERTPGALAPHNPLAAEGSLA